MYARCLKRIVDFIFALMAMVILLPILLILTVTGAVAMKGNPFFVQPRPGKKGKDGREKIFKLLKFRTMNNKKDQNGNFLPDEARLNRYGRFLRSTSADELPSLINIVKGDLAFVGPRPLLVKYLPRYSEEQRHRHDVRPGLTGYAQVHGRNAISWEERFELDIYYVNQISFKLDLQILLETIRVVLHRTGISSQTSETMEEFMPNEKEEVLE